MAGTFYPGDPERLAAVVDRDLALALATPGPGGPPKAVVVPHAGYVYSGPVAASAYARLAPRRGHISRVVLLGPAHRVAVRSMAVPSVDAFATPLGLVPLDTDGVAAARACPGVEENDRAHAAEHSLEVQLPFLQRVLGEGWRLVPIVVGGAGPAAVAHVLDVLWGGDDTLVVISSDLSHYHDYATAARLDRATAAAVVGRQVEALAPDRACGSHPLSGLLEEARRRDLPVELLDLRSSGDTAGDHDRVVGYGAFAVG